MPLQRSDGNQTVRIHLPTEGEWIDVKATLGVRDRREIKKAMLSAARMGSKNEVEGYDVGIALDVSEFAVLEHAFVKGKVYDRPGGKLISMHVGMLRDLDEESLDHLRQQLNELYPEEPDEDEVKNSTGAGQPSDEGVAQRRKNSSG